MAVGVVLLLAVLALLAPPALSSASAQRATPTATIVQQAALLKQGKWRAMYATFTARFQTVAAVTFQHRDVYVRIGSRWFDELDRVSTC